MERTTVYVPMPVWQALVAVRCKTKTWRSLPAREPHQGESFPGLDGDLTGFSCRQQALQSFGRTGFAGEFALLHVVLPAHWPDKWLKRSELDGSYQLTVPPFAFDALDLDARFLMEVVPGAAPAPRPPQPLEFGAGPTGFGGC
jgi:hypothetical protein